MNIIFVDEKNFIIEYYVHISEILYNEEVAKNGKIKSLIKGTIDYIKNKIKFDTNSEETEIKINKNLIKELKKEDKQNKPKILNKLLKILLATSILTNSFSYAAENISDNIISKTKIEQIQNFSDTELYEILKTEFANDLKFVKGFNKLSKEKQLNILKEANKIFDKIQVNENYKLIKEINNKVKMKIFYDSNNDLYEDDKIELETFLRIGTRKVIMKELYVLAKNMDMLDKTGNFKPEFKKYAAEYLSNLTVEIYPTSGGNNKYLKDRYSLDRIGFGGYAKTTDKKKYTVRVFAPGLENFLFISDLKENGLFEKYMASIFNTLAHETGHSLSSLYNIKEGKFKAYYYPEPVAIYMQNHTGLKTLNFQESYKVLQLMLKNDVITERNLYDGRPQKFLEAIKEKFAIDDNHINKKGKLNKEIVHKIKNDILKNMIKNKKDYALRIHAVVLAEATSNNRGYSPFYGEYNAVTGLNKGKYADKVIKNIINNPNDTLLQENLNRNLTKRLLSAETYSTIYKLYPEKFNKQEKDLLLKATLSEIFTNYKKLYENAGILGTSFVLNSTKSLEKEVIQNKQFFNYVYESAMKRDLKVYNIENNEDYSMNINAINNEITQPSL